MTQPDLFTSIVHINENNESSQSHLNNNRIRFSKQCLTLIHAMLNGEKLTSEKAVFQYHIMSPIRRFNDIIEAGIAVRYEWDTEHRYKELSIPEENREQVKNILPK